MGTVVEVETFLLGDTLNSLGADECSLDPGSLIFEETMPGSLAGSYCRGLID